MKAGRIIFRRASGFHSISPPGKGEYIQHTVRSAKVKQKVPEYCNQLMECFNQQYAVEGNRLNYTYDEKKKAGRFVLSGDASMIQKMLAILQES